MKYNIPSSVKYALVTGASSGIGLAYCQELARRKISLVIVSNQNHELKVLAKQLQEQFSIKVFSFFIDLTAENAAERVFDFCLQKKIQIDLLINNAGIFFFKEVIHCQEQKIETILQLHIMTLTRLSILFAKDMAKRKTGFIIQMSSLSAFMSFPGISLYAASKSYVRSFSRSLYYEMRAYNVGITVACPGAIDTSLYNLSKAKRKLALKLKILMPPQKLVKIILKKTFAKKQQVIPGFINVLFLSIIFIIPNFFIFFLMNFFSIFKKE